MDQSQKIRNERIIVTDALPYANGPIHIGHIAGVHLPADIYTRYLQKRGKDVIHICGTDENGVPITLAAEEEKITPKDLVRRYHNMIVNSLEKLGIKFDNFSGTSRVLHHKLAQEVFLKLFHNGYIEPRITEEMYCLNCKRFLSDRYIEGTCPHCGYPNARGDSCESCGSWLEPEELENPRCKLCKSTPQKKKTKHWYLMLNEFQKNLEKWIQEKKWKKTVKSYLQGWLNEGLKPRPITRDLNWGVPVPLKEASDKVLYVWFDAPLGYISSTIEWAEKIGKPEKWKSYWKNKETKLIHFIGKDNIVFHGIIWPAVLMGIGEYILPDEIPANEFLNLEGQKISTSNNWAVWVHEYLEEFEPDFLRYYLTCIIPETKDSDFKWKEFQDRVNSELINNLGNFVNRTLKFIEKYTGGKIPKPCSFNEEDKKMLERVNSLIIEIEDAIANFQFRRAAMNWMKISATGNRYYDQMKPWIPLKENEKRMATTIYLCSHIIHILATIGELFIPFGAKKIYSMLNLEEKEWDKLGEISIPSNHPIGKVRPLFKKVEDEKIEKQIRRLRMSHLSIDDFKEMDLKVGVIKEVDEVPGADKLYKLTVDTGESRTLVAGIKECYTPDELKGKRIVVITNLEPATIMGVRSEGMLLAAIDGDTISIISPDKDVSPGADVS
ncbi:MAG: methionine--tRNA ligase [candidate division WOR-3 bacterium]|nr:methionine--tRNA ligase [candidate division WOR-3 bacterium]